MEIKSISQDHVSVALSYSYLACLFKTLCILFFLRKYPPATHSISENRVLHTVIGPCMLPPRCYHTWQVARELLKI